LAGPRPDDFLGDSVRLAAVDIEGSTDPRVIALVTTELDLAEGDFVDRDDLRARLDDLDATGLFRLVRYRLDRAGESVILAVTVEERPRDRLAVGLRYDDEYRAALLFTAALHNVLAYGSVTRFDLRVGEETRIGATLGRRRGVTGRLGFALSAHWSQGELALLPLGGGRSGIEMWTGRLSLGLAVGRGTSVAFELTGERAGYPEELLDVRLFSGSLVLDHETLDRIDFPRSGADVIGRIEWGSTNVATDGDFSAATLNARYFVRLHDRLTADVGAWLGHQSGRDLPLHRRFYLGGAHRSAVFGTTHATFQGLSRQEHSGNTVQVARLGLRWQVTGNGYLRAGVDIGAAREAWKLPVERPMTGWALTAGTATLIGPVELQLAKVWGEQHDPRLSVSVGRGF
jgi:outer membrane protein assembly factor BamA